MKVFLVNLERRPDRLAAMTEQLNRLGIAFERFDAVDGAKADPAELSAPFAASGPLGALSSGDKACTFSHLHLWRRIGAGSDSHAVILEDDIHLSDDARPFLTTTEWIPREAGLVKLEKFGGERPVVVIGKDRRRALDREVAPLLSRHTGSGGYIIAREKAAALANLAAKFTLPIDHLLFNPSNSPVFRMLQPWQLLPAILDQREAVGGATDIHASRKVNKPRGLALAKRQLTRVYYDFRLVPKQILQVLSGRAEIVRVDTA